MHEREKNPQKKQDKIFMSDKTIKKIHCAGRNENFQGHLIILLLIKACSAEYLHLIYHSEFLKFVVLICKL